MFKLCMVENTCNHGSEEAEATESLGQGQLRQQNKQTRNPKDRVVRRAEQKQLVLYAVPESE